MIGSKVGPTGRRADGVLAALRRHVTRHRLPGAILPRVAIAVLLAATAVSSAATSANQGWDVVGQQGLVRFVIVPSPDAGDQAAYEREIVKLCEPERTCFLNFYTNTSGAAATVPLPDAIANEATATYRRSMKNGVQIFMWSCRMRKPAQECF